jgi:hypothetical protein
VIKTTFSKRDFFQKLNGLIPGQAVVPAAQPAPLSEPMAGSTLVGSENPQPASTPAAAGESTRPHADETHLQELVDNWE